MIQFAADFESSKEIVYKENKNLPVPAYRVVEKDKRKELKKCEWTDRVVDRQKSKTWVYLWGIETLDMEFYKVGYSIDSFMEFIFSYTDDMRIYFHNEKFDGSFILYWLLQRPHYKQLLPETNAHINDFFKDNPDKKRLFTFFDDTKQFANPIFAYFKAQGMTDKKGICQEDGVYYQTSVNNMGIMYSIKIYVFKSGEPIHKIEIFDSYKLLQFSIDTLGKEFLNEKDFEKEEYDYDIVRLENRPDLLTDKDFSYLKRDIDILAKSLTLLRQSKDIVASPDKQTTASLALDEFKTLLYEQVTNKKGGTPKQKERVFREVFPVLSNTEDTFVREGYKGGFCYVHPAIKGRLLTSQKGMCVIDVNSLFPYIMLTNPMPWGWPLWSSDEKIIEPVVNDEVYDYYFTRVRVVFDVKHNHIPSIMLKGTDIVRPFNKDCKDLPLNKYLNSSFDKEVELILSKDDYELMHQQYNIRSEFIVETYYFKTIQGIFDNYINKWGEVKIKADNEGNQTNRQIAKLFLNSLYGKFGAKPINVFKFFEMADGVLTMHPTEEKKDKPVYVPVAAAITAGGRRKTIEASQKILDYGIKKYNDVMYCYSDTDSIHTRLTKDEVIDCLGVEVDKDNTKKLGLWALEETNIIKSKFLRAKSYLEEREKPNKKGKILASGCAGLPSDIQAFLTFEAFEEKSIFVGKLSPIQVIGGLALVEDKFTLKED